MKKINLVIIYNLLRWLVCWGFLLDGIIGIITFDRVYVELGIKCMTKTLEWSFANHYFGREYKK